MPPTAQRRVSVSQATTDLTMKDMTKVKRIVPHTMGHPQQVKQLPCWDRTSGSLQWECLLSGFFPAAPTVYLLVVPRIEPKPVWHHRSKAPISPEARICDRTWGQIRTQLKISPKLSRFWLATTPRVWDEGIPIFVLQDESPIYMLRLPEIVAAQSKIITSLKIFPGGETVYVQLGFHVAF